MSFNFNVKIVQIAKITLQYIEAILQEENNDESLFLSPNSYR